MGYNQPCRCRRAEGTAERSIIAVGSTVAHDGTSSFIEWPITNQSWFRAGQLTHHGRLYLSLCSRHVPQAHLVELPVQRINLLRVIPHREWQRVDEDRLPDCETAIQDTVQVKAECRPIIRHRHMHPGAEGHRCAPVQAIQAVTQSG